MQITLALPDDVAHCLEAEVKDLPRALLESFALEGYRSGSLTEEQVRRVLGYGTRMQVDAFLKAHALYWNYTLEDLDRDAETSREFSNR
jgi:Uncharacterised protein family (UPF0175)